LATLKYLADNMLIAIDITAAGRLMLNMFLAILLSITLIVYTFRPVGIYRVPWRHVNVFRNADGGLDLYLPTFVYVFVLASLITSFLYAVLFYAMALLSVMFLSKNALLIH